MERTFSDVRDLRLDLRVPSGRVDVDAGGAEGTVELRLEPLTEAAGELLGEVVVDLRPRGAGHELVVDVPERRGGFGWLFGRGPEFGLSVRCPPETSVSLRSGSADFGGRGVLRALELKTASGDVEVDEVRDSAVVATASGDVRVGSARGRVELQTASGDVEIGTVDGPLRASLVSGDLSVRSASGPVRTSSVSGDQGIECVSQGPVELQSVSGDITVGVRRGVDVWLDVRSVSGDTTSALTPSEGPRGDAGPLVELRVKSVSGDVRIEQAPAAATA